jgi:hypothetical protein
VVLTGDVIYTPLRARYVACDPAQTNVLRTVYSALPTKDIVPVRYNYLLAVNIVQPFKHSLLEPEGSSPKQQQPPSRTHCQAAYVCPTVPCSVLGLQLCATYVKFVYIYMWANGISTGLHGVTSQKIVLYHKHSHWTCLCF